MPNPIRRLNVITECRSARLSLWSCPPFLFIVMGFVDISAMLGSYLLANRFLDESQVILLITAVAVLIFVIGNFIIQGFNQIAEANRIKTEFIAVVSHQLRSPLSVFKWVLDAVAHAKGGAPRDSTTESYLAMLRENAEKMIQLVNMLLEVSRLEAGRMVVRAEPVRLDLLTDEAVRAYAAYARASNVAIRYPSPPHFPPARGDREKMKMVIQNLMDNAIRYSKSGGEAGIALAFRNPHTIEWTIRDAGIGIAPEDQRHIFEKFYRTRQAAQRQVRGSGLGLYIARSLIIAQGGNMGFESFPGRGTTFWFTLPVFVSSPSTQIIRIMGVFPV